MGFKEFFNKHKTKILAATGVVAAGAVKKGNQTPGGEKSKQGTPQAHSAIDLRIAYIEDTGYLQKESLVAIHNLIAKRVSAFYLKKSVDSRKARRKHLTNLKEYIKECNKFQNELQNLIGEVTAKIHEEARLPPETYQAAFEYHTKKEGSEDFLDRVGLPDTAQIGTRKQLSKQDVLQLYKYQQAIMEEAVKDLVKGLGSDGSAEELDRLLEFRLADLTAEAMGIEEEDLLSTTNNQLLEDAEVKAAIEKRDDAKRTSIIRHAHF